MKTKKLLLKVTLGLLILIPLGLNSCEKEEHHKWCVDCTFRHLVIRFTEPCYETYNEAVAKKEYDEMTYDADCSVYQKY